MRPLPDRFQSFAIGFEMDFEISGSKGLLILLAAAGYAAATYFMKHAAHAGELVSVGLAMLVFQLVVAVEILLLRRMDLSNAYVMILGVETLMIVALALWYGERFTLREAAGAGLVIAGLFLVAD